MSDLQNNIFEAIDSLVSRRIESTPIDLTITAEIALLRNVDIGEYKVSYKGDTFSAYSLDPMTVYKQGEEVYVLVPRGDYSSKKVILGKAAFNDKISYTDRQAMSNQWRTRGPNWLSPEWYWRAADGTSRADLREAHIVAAAQEDDEDIVHPSANWRQYIFHRAALPMLAEQNYTAARQQATQYPTEQPNAAALDIVDKDLQMWGSQLEYIMVRANFETSLLSTHSTGEYGILIECYAENPKYGIVENEPQYIIMPFRLGFGDFNGAPYSFSQPTPQYAVFPAPKGVIKGLARVSLFQTDGWKTDIQPVSVDPSNPLVENPAGRGLTFEVPPAKLVLDRNNISATDIEIYWCEPVNLSERLFWLKIETIRGTSLYNTPNQAASWITSLPIRARLMYGGEDVTSQETCKFIWFRQKYSALRDLAADTEEDEFGNTWAAYLPEGENGWAPIVQMIKSPTEDPALGQNAAYQLGIMNDTLFVEDANFHEALQVPIEEVPWQWRYMVVCYYNPRGGSLEEVQRSKQNDALIWDTIVIHNKSSIHDFELPMAQVGENLSDIFLRVRNNALPWAAGVPYDPFNPTKNDPQRDWYCRWWWAAGQSYNAMQVDGDAAQQRFHKGSRRIDQLLLNEPITFKAQIYAKKNPSGATSQAIVGDAAQPWPDPAQTGNPDMTAEYNDLEIANIERAITPDNNAAVHVEFIGQRTHNYNADGKIRLAEMADTQYNIRAKITPRDNSIVLFSAEWLAPDRTPLKSLSAAEVVMGTGYTPQPQNSMLKDMWMNVPNQTNIDRSLHYKVSDTYDIDRVGTAENTFILQIRFLNGTIQEVPCEINFQKADSNGSQGSEWTAQIWPCNATPTLDGLNAVSYTPWTRMIQEHPRPLVVSGNWNPVGVPASGYSRNTNYRLFLRPFITRNGEALESLNEASKYTYKVFWDVRYPVVKATNSARAAASNGSFLELSHVGISGRAATDLGRDGNLATGTPYTRGPTIPANVNNYQAYTHSLDRENQPYSGVDGNSAKTYGAIEVRWGNKPNVNNYSFKDLDYSFVVKARIEIYYDGKGVASITSFHGVDVLFTNGSIINSNNFKPSMIKTNWPKEVMYNSSGLSPVLSNQALSFYYGSPQYTSATSEPFPMTAMPINLTPGIQDLNVAQDGLNVRGPYSSTIVYRRTEAAADVVFYEGFYFAVKEIGDLPVGIAPDRLAATDPNWRRISDLTSWKLLPRSFYFFEEMDNGALATDIVTNTGKWPNGSAVNPDFATWGAAVYVRPIVYFLSQYGNEHINGWDGKCINLNKTDGTIFAPTIGAGWKHPFTNTFSGVLMGIDKSQLKNTYLPEKGGFSTDNISQNPYMTGLFGYQDGVNSFGILENGTAFFGRADRGGRIVIDGFNAQIFGGLTMNNRTGLDADMRNRMRLSFIDFTGLNNLPTQGPTVDGEDPINLQPYNVDSFHSFFASEIEDPDVESFTGYLTQHSYSTPAIEIGSYKDWLFNPDTGARISSFLPRNRGGYRSGAQLIRGISPAEAIGWQDAIAGLEIPGYRRFMVTYDGTLYAMNAFIKGTLASSNIIGSNFFDDKGMFGIMNGHLWAGKSGSNGFAERFIAALGTWSITPPSVTNPYSAIDILNSSPGKITNIAQNIDAVNVLNSIGTANMPAFFVANDGRVFCQEIHIAGQSSINIGGFHVLPRGGNNSGDVVSFGTMYLVGPGNQSNYGIAAEGWGDFYLRGKLVNLGGVFLGGSPDKNTNESTGLNSPLFIQPFGQDYYSSGGFWPLYFHGEANNAWVALSTGGAMPSFATRTTPILAGITLGYNTIWRVDSTGMWSDAIFFTKNGPSSESPMVSSNAQAAIGFGTLGGANAFVMKTTSNDNPHILIESQNITRMTAPQKVVISAGTLGNAPVSALGLAIADSVGSSLSAASLGAGQVIIAAQANFSDSADVHSFLSVGGIGWSTRTITDEANRDIGILPAVDSGAIWIKGRKTVIDATGVNAVSTEQYNATIRLNRTFTGDLDHIAAGGQNIDINGSIAMQADNGIIIQGGASNSKLVVAGITADNQFGIYARFA